MLLFSACLAGLVRLILSALLLFGVAGTVAWPKGWVVLGLLSGLSALGQVTLACGRPNLAAERLRPGAGQPRVDRVLGAVLALSFNLWLAALGLERRFGIEPLAPWLAWPGIGLALAGQALSFAAQWSNTFASSAMRIQPERGHRVVMHGPYRAIRHPIYAANLLLLTGGALLAGSWMGLALTPFFAGLFAFRITLEERQLRAALPAYTSYAAATRWRLFPFLW